LITFLSLEIAAYINRYVPDYYVGTIVSGGQVIIIIIVLVTVVIVVVAAAAAADPSGCAA
jgi:uncharacterized membrane protein YraQ (UPF0718 family)